MNATGDQILPDGKMSVLDLRTVENGQAGEPSMMTKTLRRPLIAFAWITAIGICYSPVSAQTACNDM